MGDKRFIVHGNRLVEAAKKGNLRKQLRLEIWRIFDDDPAIGPSRDYVNIEELPVGRIEEMMALEYNDGYNGEYLDINSDADLEFEIFFLEFFYNSLITVVVETPARRSFPEGGGGGCGCDIIDGKMG